MMQFRSLLPLALGLTLRFSTATTNAFWKPSPFIPEHSVKPTTAPLPQTQIPAPELEVPHRHPGDTNQADIAIHNLCHFRSHKVVLWCIIDPLYANGKQLPYTLRRLSSAQICLQQRSRRQQNKPYLLVLNIDAVIYEAVKHRRGNYGLRQRHHYPKQRVLAH